MFPHTDDGRDAQRPSDLDQVSARVAAQRARPTAPLSIGARAGTGKATTTARPGAAEGACGSLTTVTRPAPMPGAAAMPGVAFLAAISVAYTNGSQVPGPSAGLGADAVPSNQARTWRG